MASDDAFLVLQDDEEIEEDSEVVWDQAAAVAVGVVVVGSHRAHAAQVRRREGHRAYLLRGQLLPNPRVATPWQVLHESRVDSAFIVTMGLDVRAFELILNAGFEHEWSSQPIPRNDVPDTGDPRPERRSLDAAGALGLVLHYLNSTMREISLQQIFALIPTTVTRYIDFGLTILLKTLQHMPEAAITWPQGSEFEDYARLVQARHNLLFGAFGSIDGLNLPCQTSDDEEIENATYNGWLHEHFISSVLVFSPRGMIIAARMNCPGSWHDSRVAFPIYEKLRTRTPEGYYLVSDTAFPRGTSQIDGRIHAPRKQGERLPLDAAEAARVLAFDRDLLSFRQTAEWGMHAIQGSFGRLRIPLEIAHDHRRGDLLETCVRLHNIRTFVVGINQIRSVYEPLWREDAEQDKLWDTFPDMLFKEQRKNDRVSKFHHVIS